MQSERKYTSENRAGSRISGVTAGNRGSHTNSTSNSTFGSAPRSFGGLRSRYHAFLEKHTQDESPSQGSRVSQGAINIAIFCALVVVILTAFGIGLSWFGGSQKETSVQSGKSDGTESPTGLAQPTGPAGHADFRSQTSVEKKSDGK
jgi:hypothetical protein